MSLAMRKAFNNSFPLITNAQIIFLGEPLHYFSRLIAASVSSQITRNLRKCDQDTKHSGFFNKGNTCYVNSILQALSAIPSFWCQSASESGFLSPLTRAVTLNMSLLKRRTTPLDSSNFLWALCRKLSINKQVPFQFNIQQDVSEILQVVLDESKGHSTIASYILAISVRTSTTCGTCGCCKTEEVKLDIIPLPLAKPISLSLDRFVSSENLTRDKWFCPSCNGFMDSTRETKIVDSGSILIVQLLRYDNFKGAVIKNNLTVNCSETLKLPISANEQVCLFKEFNLRHTINHSGTLQAGHYWAHIKDKDNRGW